MYKSNILTNKRGTSLIEILVTIVVLMVGILIIIEMFPSGFTVVRAAENRTIAGRMASQEVDRWKAMSASLPDGFAAVDDSGALLPLDITDKYQISGPPFQPFESIGNGSYKRANILNLRKVIGEVTTIPLGSYFQSANGDMYGSPYTMAFGPIDAYRDSEDKLVGIKIKSGDLGRRLGDRQNNNYPPPLKYSDYAIDYVASDAKYKDGNKDVQQTKCFSIALPTKEVGKKYSVSYSYWRYDKYGQIERVNVMDQEIDAGDAVDTILNPNMDGWINVPILMKDEAYPDQDIYIPDPKFIQMDPYSDSCARAFVENKTGAWSDNPYEFVLVDPICGLVAFNPKGHGMYEYTAQGMKQLEAKINYLIYDQRIIHEDRHITKPSVDQDTNIVKLSLRRLLDAGDPAIITDGNQTLNPDEPTFEGLMRGTNLGSSTTPNWKPQLGKIITSSDEVLIKNSVLIIDKVSGLWVKPLDADGNEVSEQNLINFNDGAIKFPVTAGKMRAHLTDWYGNSKLADIDLVGRDLRFLYRSQGDWSVQCIKAFSNYTRDYGTSGGLDYKSYRRVDVLENNDPNKITECKLLFSRFYSGQTVAIDYSYAYKGIEYKVAGESHRISDDVDDSNCYIGLNIPNDGKVTQVQVYAVMGLSFRARVIYRDGRFWRYVDSDAIVVRKPSKI